MTDTFLFRFDGSRENDRYLELARERGFMLFAGMELRLGPGWIPDYMKVGVDGGNCHLTIIELESDPNTARISARKYLPESSRAVVQAFIAYLERACIQCRTTADPRLGSIARLKQNLQDCDNVIVATAGYQRHSLESVEELPLIDQDPLPRGEHVMEEKATEVVSLARTGDVILTPVDHKDLSRTVLILDAVVRGWDKSGASMRAWRNSRSQPLRRAVRADRTQYPELTALLLGNKVGSKINIERLAAELATMWDSLVPGKRYAPDSVIEAVQQYLPIAKGLQARTPVRVAFDKARAFL